MMFLYLIQESIPDTSGFREDPVLYVLITGLLFLVAALCALLGKEWVSKNKVIDGYRERESKNLETLRDISVAMRGQNSRLDQIERCVSSEHETTKTLIKTEHVGTVHAITTGKG